jgi:hypothetical protein
MHPPPPRPPRPPSPLRPWPNAMHGQGRRQKLIAPTPALPATGPIPPPQPTHLGCAKNTQYRYTAGGKSIEGWWLLAGPAALARLPGTGFCFFAAGAGASTALRLAWPQQSAKTKAWYPL